MRRGCASDGRSYIVFDWPRRPATSDAARAACYVLAVNAGALSARARDGFEQRSKYRHLGGALRGWCAIDELHPYAGSSDGIQARQAGGSFVRETRGQTFNFYRELVQNLKLWQVRPSKLHESPEPKTCLTPPDRSAAVRGRRSTRGRPGNQPISDKASPTLRRRTRLNSGLLHRRPGMPRASPAPRSV
jgi:hypothetical protein